MKSEGKLCAWVRVISKPGQVCSGPHLSDLRISSIICPTPPPTQLVVALLTPEKPKLLPSSCSISPPQEKTKKGQHVGEDPKRPLCHGLVSLAQQGPTSPGLSPGAVHPSWHSPAQRKELAVAVERHIPQVENLQPREVAHVGDVVHFVALQVEASDLGTEASESTRRHLQQSKGE